MPNQKEPNLREGMGFKDAIKTEKNDFDKIESKIDELDKRISGTGEKQPLGIIGESQDQEEPLTLGRKIDKILRQQRPFTILSLSIEEKIQLIDFLFPIALGDEVRNKFDEVGYVESVSIDRRGVLYLVRYKTHEILWESEYQIEKISLHLSSDEVSEEKQPNLIKTDIPDPKTHTVGDRKSEME